MAWCEDQFLTYLKGYGWSPVRLPRAGLAPLDVYRRQGKSLDRLGDLPTILVGGTNIPVPSVLADNPAATISGKRTSDLSAGLGLSVLGTVIGAMGGSSVGLDQQYQQAKTIAFAFPDVLEDRVDIARLDQYLADADINPFSRWLGELLDADEIYVTTATIKARKLVVDAKTARNASVQVRVPEIQGIVGGNVTVSGADDMTAQITYEGNVPLVFGFQAVQLFYDRGRYTRIKPLPPGDTAVRALDEAVGEGSTLFLPEGPFVRLSGIEA